MFGVQLPSYQELATYLETRNRFPELVVQEEKRVRFVVAKGLDIVERPTIVPVDDAEWYNKREIHNLARFISIMKFHPLSWRTAHHYVLDDRFEDVTPSERVRLDKKCDRNVTVYGYLRGCN